jgi:hypothetical protein
MFPRRLPGSAVEAIRTTTTGSYDMKTTTDACGQQWVDHGMGWVPLGIPQDYIPAMRPQAPQPTDSPDLQQCVTFDVRPCPTGQVWVTKLGAGRNKIQLCCYKRVGPPTLPPPRPLL